MTIPEHSGTAFSSKRADGFKLIGFTGGRRYLKTRDLPRTGSEDRHTGIQSMPKKTRNRKILMGCSTAKALLIFTYLQ